MLSCRETGAVFFQLRFYHVWSQFYQKFEKLFTVSLQTVSSVFVTSSMDAYITRSGFTLEEVCMNRVTDFLLAVSANSESCDFFRLISQMKQSYY